MVRRTVTPHQLLRLIVTARLLTHSHIHEVHVFIQPRGRQQRRKLAV